jgi:hypothetical protein
MRIHLALAVTAWCSGALAQDSGLYIAHGVGGSFGSTAKGVFATELELNYLAGLDIANSGIYGFVGPSAGIGGDLFRGDVLSEVQYGMRGSVLLINKWPFGLNLRFSRSHFITAQEGFDTDRWIAQAGVLFGFLELSYVHSIPVSGPMDIIDRNGISIKICINVATFGC